MMLVRYFYACGKFAFWIIMNVQLFKFHHVIRLLSRAAWRHHLVDDDGRVLPAAAGGARVKLQVIRQDKNEASAPKELPVEVERYRYVARIERVRFDSSDRVNQPIMVHLEYL